MKFFVDTAEIDQIRELNDLGMVDGVTTNPSLIKKSGRDIIEVTKQIPIFWVRSWCSKDSMMASSLKKKMVPFGSI